MSKKSKIIFDRIYRMTSFFNNPIDPVHPVKKREE